MFILEPQFRGFRKNLQTKFTKSLQIEKEKTFFYTKE